MTGQFQLASILDRVELEASRLCLLFGQYIDSGLIGDITEHFNHTPNPMFEQLAEFSLLLIKTFPKAHIYFICSKVKWVGDVGFGTLLLLCITMSL